MIFGVVILTMIRGVKRLGEDRRWMKTIVETLQRRNWASRLSLDRRKQLICLCKQGGEVFLGQRSHPPLSVVASQTF